MSIDINRNTLESSTRSLKLLEDTVGRIKDSGKDRLENEYRRLLEGIHELIDTSITSIRAATNESR